MLQPDPVYADADLVAVDKPHGLPSVPGRAAGLQDCAYCRVRDAFPDALVVHRLDMPTSGLLLFARGAVNQRILSRAFADRGITKHYVAEVDGDIMGDEGIVDLPLRADWPNRPRQVVDRLGGKPSLTHWRRLRQPASARDRSRLELRPLTGRTHQLRVHLQAIGHPIVGDTLYGPAQDAESSFQRLHLHAHRLAFTHPRTGLYIELSSPVPF
jgi:tRNA pseudouridine32 synthase/23S rRNA pseudouridine746 synthase